MKKFQTPLLILAGFLILWALSPSRSDKVSEAGVQEIRFLQPSGPISSPMDDAVREFEKQSREAHAKDPSKPIYRVISGQNASRDPTEDPSRFLISVAGGMPPEVIAFDRFAVSEWAARGAFTPIDSFLEKDLKDRHPDAVKRGDFYASAWDETIYTDPRTGKGGTYGVPFNLDDRALFYNKDLLKRAGYVDKKGEARPPKTWEELEEMSLKLTEKDSRGFARRMGFVPNFGNTFLYIYGWMNGGEFMSADGKTCTLNDPKIVGALEWMTRIYDQLGGAKEVYAFQSTFQGGDLDPFLLGKVALKIDGVWKVNELAQWGKNLAWGCAAPPMPAAEKARGRETLSWVGGWCYAIPSTAKNKDAAWALIRYLSTWKAVELMTEGEKLNAQSQGWTFVPRQHPNRVFNERLAKNYVYDDPSTDPKISNAVRVFNDLLKDSRYRPVSMVGQLLWNQQIDAMEDAIFHKRSPKEALDRGTGIVQRQLDQGLSPPRGRPVHWPFFIGLYVAVVIAFGVLVFYWDTQEGFRRKIAGLLKPLGAGAVSKLGGDLGDFRTKYFRGQWKDGWILASPWLLGFVLLTGGPIAFSALISFCDYDILNPARLVGFENYKEMVIDDPLFWKSLGNTLFMVMGIPLGMSLSLGIALLLNQNVKGVPVWRTFFYVPSIIPAVASSILWVWILNPSNGLLNGALASVGIQGPNWLQDENTSKISLIFMGLWGAGGGMIVWLAGLKGISESYYEAAAIDGAGTLQKFRHVTLPMISPYIFFNLIMGLIGTFQIFTEAFVMTKGGPVNSTLFYVYYLFNQAFRYLQMGYASAIAWFLFIIIFALTLVQLSLSKRWVHYEGD